MEKFDLKKRAVFFKRRVDQQKNANLLPDYPVKVYPHMSDNKLRERKPKLYRKFNFETKH